MSILVNEKRGTSNAPLILAILGAVINLPNILCSTVCAGICAATSASMAVEAPELAGGLLGSAGVVFVLGTVLPVASSIFAFIFGLLAKKMPIFSGIILVICSLLNIAPIVFTLNVFILITIGLFLAGGIVSFVQKKEE